MKVKLINQTLDIGDDYWSKRSCGICVLKMLMVFKKPELENISIMTLLNQALEMNGYIENIGWKHQALVDLATRYGVELDFQREFFNTPERKKEGLKTINKKLNSGMPIAASVLKDFDVSASAHLVVVEGLSRFWPFVLGYKIVDSYSGKMGSHYVVSKKEFLAGWRGGMIWLK